MPYPGGTGAAVASIASVATGRFRVSSIAVTPGPEYLVEWTDIGIPKRFRQYHCSVEAARRHVKGLLGDALPEVRVQMKTEPR